ncbi:MAG: STAS domain-containing protein [Planctomycetes bacterium]|nr:STAS domain-containing protein [Planctomycetota bacterium]
MKIAEQECGAVRVLRPEGPLTGKDADELKGHVSRLLDGSMGRCVVDASAIQYADSRGLEVLVEANDEIVRTGHPLKLSGVNETLRQVLELTGLAPQFEFFADVNAAVRSFL